MNPEIRDDATAFTSGTFLASEDFVTPKGKDGKRLKPLEQESPRPVLRIRWDEPEDGGKPGGGENKPQLNFSKN